MSNVTTMDNVIPRSDIVKSAARLGAEIKNIKLSDGLSDEVICAISQLLLEHKVIFFRDQGHLDDAEQQRFALRLGSLIPRTTKGTSTRDMAPGRGSGHADQTHMDVTFGDPCPKISVLRGVVVPPDGDDIIWASTAAAYLDLPEPLRMLANNLWAVHCSAYDCTVTRHAIETDTQQFDGVFTGTICETACPVVRVHPETGERLLVLGHSVQNFVGLGKYVSQKLFDRLQSYLTARENAVSWSWKAGDVVIWDNRATERYAVKKSSGRHRVERRIAIDEDMPLSVVGPRGGSAPSQSRKRPRPPSLRPLIWSSATDARDSKCAS
ncbi:TauD/TfdA family dioxygenase [Bradyrhizobium sp. 23]|uniref:TauD/TfdA dioxygenase family protein n=1 Tax=Bradyrhizobium sp. 23 TaxID=2782667 RepID=UPI001FFAC7B8|nr:TauD/TfdA family dioxygenase [Bradyrhizobium sp. 23]MCK1312896.1 TauD/TfdA family dioxygenase [Bradyrhizobium sp. 23]